MKRLITAAAIFFAIPSFAEGDVFVLCYHSFLGKGKKVFTDFSPSEFENQMFKLRELGYRFVGFDDILAGRVYGKNNILITIDDGNHSIRDIYGPILQKYQIKPVLFIYPAIIGRKKYALNPSELRLYQEEGAFIGAHGYNHQYVNEKLYENDKITFKREIYKSREKLTEMMGNDIFIYAYPFGSFSPITEQTLEKAGYQYGFSLKRDILKVPLYKNEDRFNLPRWMVTQGSWREIYSVLKRYSVSGTIVKETKPGAKKKIKKVKS